MCHFESSQMIFGLTNELGHRFHIPIKTRWHRTVLKKLWKTFQVLFWPKSKVNDFYYCTLLIIISYLWDKPSDCSILTLQNSYPWQQGFWRVRVRYGLLYHQPGTLLNFKFALLKIMRDRCFCIFQITKVPLNTSRVGVVVARLTCINRPGIFRKSMRRSLVQSGYVAFF